MFVMLRHWYDCTTMTVAAYVTAYLPTRKRCLPAPTHICQYEHKHRYRYIHRHESICFVLHHCPATIIALSLRERQLYNLYMYINIFTYMLAKKHIHMYVCMLYIWIKNRIWRGHQLSAMFLNANNFGTHTFTYTYVYSNGQNNSTAP